MTDATVNFLHRIKLHGCTISDTVYNKKIDNFISYHTSQVLSCFGGPMCILICMHKYDI